MKTWSEIEIQLALFQWLELRGRTLILPNFTPYRWHECDLFSLTHALYFHEIEVKISKSDFYADRNKRIKHDALNGGKRYGEYYQKGMPRTFCYACPAEMLKISVIPEYAGLLWISRNKQHYDISVIRKPPMLLGQKMTTEQVFKITNTLWWKFARTWKQMAEEKIRHGNKEDGKL